MCPQQELNLHHSLRTGLLYPLSYGGFLELLNYITEASYFTLRVYKFVAESEDPRLVSIKILDVFENGKAEGIIYEPEYTVCLFVPS